MAGRKPGRRSPDGTYRWAQPLRWRLYGWKNEVSGGIDSLYVAADGPFKRVLD